MDGHVIHHGVLRGRAARGGKVVNDARVEAIERKAGRWVLRAGGETYAAPVVVNAAGAWADEIGRLAGLPAIGLVPKRRTAVMVEPPAGIDLKLRPAVDQLAHDHSLQPDADRLMQSPRTDTPFAPCPAHPEHVTL